LIQDGFDRYSRKLITQVFAASPLLLKDDDSMFKAYWYQKFITVAYESAAKAAVIKASITGKQVNLHLVLLGVPSVSYNGVSEALAIIRGFDVVVYFHLALPRGPAYDSLALFGKCMSKTEFMHP
jgi:hypothetical protein